MSGRDVLNNALREVPANIFALLDANHLTVHDVDLFVLHQASKFMVQLLRDTLAVDEHKLPFDISTIGNTISSSIPIMLKRYMNDPTNQLIVLCGCGVGFSYASNLIKLVNQGD